MPDLDPPKLDPVDEAYRKAEALLDDDVARAARRARVFAAVQAEPPVAAEVPAAPLPRPRRLHPAWMATAAAVVLSVLVAVNVPRPQVGPLPPAATPAPSAAAPAAETAPAAAPPAATATPPADAVGKAAKSGAADERAAAKPSPTPRAAAPSSGLHGAVAVPPLPLPPVPAPVAESPKPPSPPMASIAPPPLPPPPPPPPPPPLTLPPVPAPVAGIPAVAAKAAPSPVASASPAPGASTYAARDRSVSESVTVTGVRRAAPGGAATADPAERLRAAAAAGRTAEVEALLAQGIPVDAADSQGETALLKSVRADHPAAAAVLRRHGADPDRAAKSGETPRTLAADKADAELSKALKGPRE